MIGQALTKGLRIHRLFDHPQTLRFTVDLLVTLFRFSLFTECRQRCSRSRSTHVIYYINEGENEGVSCLSSGWHFESFAQSCRWSSTNCRSTSSKNGTLVCLRTTHCIFHLKRLRQRAMRIICNETNFGQVFYAAMVRRVEMEKAFLEHTKGRDLDVIRLQRDRNAELVRHPCV